LTAGAIIFALIHSRFMAPDLLMLYALDTNFGHIGIMSHPVSREFPFFLEKYIQRHAKCRQANKYERYNNYIQKHLNNPPLMLSKVCKFLLCKDNKTESEIRLIPK